MSVSLLFCIGGAVAFGLLGCVSKMAERRNCRASALVVSLFAWATVLMLMRTVALGSGFSLPMKVSGVGIACGACAAVAFLAYQTSIRLGQVTVAWLIMNLSAAVPAVASIVFYEERVTLIKMVALILILVSFFFLFWGRRIDERELNEQSVRRGND